MDLPELTTPISEMDLQLLHSTDVAPAREICILTGGVTSLSPQAHESKVDTYSLARHCAGCPHTCEESYLVDILSSILILSILKLSKVT